MPASDDPQPAPRVATPFDTAPPVRAADPEPAPQPTVDIGPAGPEVAAVPVRRRSGAVVALASATVVLLVASVVAAILFLNAQSRIRDLEGTAHTQDARITSLQRDVTGFRGQVTAATAERDRALAAAARCVASPTPAVSPTASAMPSAAPSSAP